MPAPAIILNPYIQTTAPGMFVIESDGFIAGTAMPDPAARYALSGGWLAQTETLPMFGGVAISENIPNEAAGNPVVPLGGAIGRATTYANLTGFSVFDQNYAAVNSPQSPVPTVGSGGLVNFYRLGCGIRVAVNCASALAASMEGGLINQQVSWDFTNQQLIAFATTALNVRVLQIKASKCMVPSYSSVTQFTTWNYNGCAALILL